MSNVSPEEVNAVSDSIKGIASGLRDRYQSIVQTIQSINQCVNTLRSWNGADASETFYEYKNIFDERLDRRTCHKYVWNVQVSGVNTVSSILSSASFSQMLENIERLDCQGEELQLLSETLAGLIALIVTELQVPYDANTVHFFNSIKDNPGWQEYKQMSLDAEEARENDELYKAYRSTDGKSDYVDYFLDEIGNRRLSEEWALDDGTNAGKGPSKYGQWYKETYPSSGMTNDAAFCAAAVTYVMQNSGNKDAIDPYIYVPTGASQAIAKASQGKGQWHAASDTSYQPQRGDIFYKSEGATSHTGVVLDSKGNDIYTIEGNTASSKYPRGTVNTRVRDKSYVNNGSSTSGYYSPDAYLNTNKNAVEISKETIDAKKSLNGANN